MDDDVLEFGERVDLITNYQSAFAIDTENPAAEVAEIIRIIHGWICEKEVKASRQFNARSFKGRLQEFIGGVYMWRSPYGTSIETLCYDGGKEKYWGVEYSHRDYGGKTKILRRRWLTEVTVTTPKKSAGEKVSLRVFVRVSYSWNPNRLMPIEDDVPPEPTVPRIVKAFVKRNACPVDINIRLNKHCLVIRTDRNAKDFLSILRAPSRVTCPLLVVTSQFAEREPFLRELSAKLLGRTVLFFLSPAVPAFDVLVDNGLDIRDNHIYLIPPSRYGTLAPQYITIPPVDDLEACRSLMLRFMNFFYRNNVILPSDTVTSLEAIKDIRRHEQAKAFRANVEDMVQRAKEEGTNEALAELEATVQTEIDRVRREERLLYDERVKTYRAKYEALLNQRCETASQGDKAAREVVSRVCTAVRCAFGKKSRFADSICEWLWLFMDRLVVTDKAKKSLRTCPKDVEDCVLPALCSLFEDVWPLYRKDTGQRLVDAYQKSGAPFELSLHESEGTRNSSKLMAARSVTWNGQTYSCETHLRMKKYGRIYFAFDEKSGKIIISHIGGHLDTIASGKKGF